MSVWTPVKEEMLVIGYLFKVAQYSRSVCSSWARSVANLFIVQGIYRLQYKHPRLPLELNVVLAAAVV